jgi:hypothetical protein
MTDAAPELPALHQSLLDDATLAALFRDLDACTRIVGVLAKRAARGQSDERPLCFDEARDAFLAGGLRSIQVRYLYNGEEWWDTLLRTPQGVRIVRIRQEAAPSGSGA